MTTVPSEASVPVQLEESLDIYSISVVSLSQDVMSSPKEDVDDCDGIEVLSNGQPEPEDEPKGDAERSISKSSRASKVSSVEQGSMLLAVCWYFFISVNAFCGIIWKPVCDQYLYFLALGLGEGPRVTYPAIATGIGTTMMGIPMVCLSYFVAWLITKKKHALVLKVSVVGSALVVTVGLIGVFTKQMTVIYAFMFLMSVTQTMQILPSKTVMTDNFTSRRRSVISANATSGKYAGMASGLLFSIYCNFRM